ncbi:MAG TPA: terminase small subunit [Stellaceae bacterium]|nr:terminase small subunit [Stellaceae bacterium]
MRISARNPDHRRIFVLALIETGSATEAAKRLGATKASAAQIGSRMLKNIEVQQELSATLKRKLDRLSWDADRALYLRRIIADTHPRDFAEVLYETDPVKAKALLKGLGDIGYAVKALEAVTRVTATGTTVRTRIAFEDRHHAIDELEHARRLEPRRDAPPLDFSDWTPEELDTLEGILRAVKARREAKPVLELERQDYLEDG